MLNFQGQQRKFEQLRAHWQAAELNEQQAEMVGKKERPTPHHVVHVEAQHNAGSNFRRKLSNGLAFISFTQRKAASAHQLPSNASLATSALSTDDSSTAILDRDDLQSPRAEITQGTVSINPTAPLLDGIHTNTIFRSPTQLPRPRTFSYIPRLVKTDCEISSAAEQNESGNLSHGAVMNDSRSLPPTRIPTPNPVHSKRRVSSPRQYLPLNPPLQTRAPNNRQSFAGTADCSPSKATVRSQTTPNLEKATSAPRTANNLATRTQVFERSFASSMPLKHVLSENIPTDKRVIQRRSQVQDGPVKRESLAVPSAASSRRSFGPNDTLVVQNKRISLAPPVSAKRLSSRFSHKPVAAKCASTAAAQATTRDLGSAHSSEEEVDVPSRSGNSEGSTNPSLLTVDLMEAPLVRPPNLGVENDKQQRTLGTPGGLGGNWKSSKIFAAANHQVRRKLPRSSTFQHFGRPEAPSSPSIPTQYKSPSSSDLSKSVQQHSKSVLFSNWHHRLPTAAEKFGSSSKSLLSDIATAHRSTEAASLKSVSTLTSMNMPEFEGQPEFDGHLRKAQDTSPGRQEAPMFVQETYVIKSGLSASAVSLTELSECPGVSTKPQLQHTERSVARPGRSVGELHALRHWSISDFFYPGSTDIPTCLQVKDYMPPLYWAGRFQSRFDQWRTETMAVMLNPELKAEFERPLDQCSLEDEKKATILIFMQLRDLCASAQAADSLHVHSFFALFITSRRKLLT